jgi:integrase/recombinase XerC
MLLKTIKDFLIYCNTCDFGVRSLKVFASILPGFNEFITNLDITSIKDISYTHLLEFVTSGNSSVHLKKQRVWALHQFFHFLKLNKLVASNIALKLPYPKIDKKEPDFFTVTELKTILRYFLDQEDSPHKSRNTLIVLFLVFLGLRISSAVALDVSDINLNESLVLIREKGDRTRMLPMPQALCSFLCRYLPTIDRDVGPLFASGRNRRISLRMVQHIISRASQYLGMHIHSHLFRHTAATHLNQVAGFEVTQQTLGHRRMENTKQYIHLNPDMYAEYMRRHASMTFFDKEFSHE